MLFNFFPWEMGLASHLHELARQVKTTPFTATFFCEDAFYAQLFLQELTKNFHGLLYDRREVALAGSLRAEDLADQDTNFSLFAERELLVVLDAENLRSNLQSYFLQRNSDKSVLLIFQSNPKSKSGKEGNFRKQLVEHNPESFHWEIKSPRFWEHHLLFDFWAAHLNLKIPGPMKEEILASLPPSSSAYVPFLQNLAAYEGEEEKGIHWADCMRNLMDSRQEFFELFDCLLKKNWNGLFEGILKKKRDFQLLHELCLFFLSQFSKLAYKEDKGGGKTKVNVFDRSLQEASKSWKLGEIRRVLKLFSELDLLCKQKNDFLWTRIEGIYLRGLKRT